MNVSHVALNRDVDSFRRYKDNGKTKDPTVTIENSDNTTKIRSESLGHCKPVSVEMQVLLNIQVQHNILQIPDDRDFIFYFFINKAVS